ncbi:leucine-rich repeat flightless-interacting protein 2 isoform X19 [Eleginops maclovinus]|uniref:leucine-rich repeat flightless-interacting protein 2 isoform X19 n=1 Tax=Eleginops maclovinus TaxID=56733 RepID=UPI00308014B9
MGTQGAGRKRSTKKDKSTAEDDALNLIAREAEARLAAKRAARAEARDIRMKELERQQKEIFQVQKKYYGLNTKVDDRSDSKWGDIEQWMDSVEMNKNQEDSERYSRSSRIQTLSDDDERMSVGSRSSVRSDLDSVGAYGGGDSSSIKKSKKKKKHKHKDRNGHDDEYSVMSSRSSRQSDESRVSRSSRLDLTSSRLSDDPRGSRGSRLDLQPTSYASSDLYSYNGLSSARNPGSTFNGYQSSLYEDSGLQRGSSSLSLPVEYSSYRTSGSRVSSRAGSARGSPVDNCGSVASFLRSAAGSSGLHLDDVTIPDFSDVSGFAPAGGRHRDVEDRDYLEKGSRAASSMTAATLTSLGGSSSRRGSGETAITVDAETSIREIKEIHELKDQIQDVESKYMQNLKEVKDALVQVEEKYRKAMVSNAQLDNEKNNLMYQVDTLKDSLMELEELLSESRRGFEDKVKECEREKHAHTVLQFQFNEMKETLKQSEELLNKHGIVLGPDLSINGEDGVADADSTLSADPASPLAQEAQTPPTEGNSMLEIRLRKLVDEREKMIEQVKKLKSQLEQKTQRNGTENSLGPDGEILENGDDPNIMELQRDSTRQISDYKFKLVKAEQEVTALEQNVTRLEGQVTRYKSASENAEKVEDELKAEKRKLQRELRSALDKVDELESNNSHLSKRLEKMKSTRGMAQTP